MADFLKTHYIDLIVMVFALVELTTCGIVMWETISNKSIIDVIWNIIFKEDDSGD